MLALRRDCRYAQHMHNAKSTDRIVLTAYTGDDATRAATPTRAERQRAAQVAYWGAQADAAASRAESAAKAGQITLAKIESEICEICTHMAIKTARQA